jgi:hypothetical protein
MSSPITRQPAEVRSPIFERGLILSVKAGTILMMPAETIYLTVPADMVDLLFEKYNIDLLKKRKQMNIWANLVEERPHIQNPTNNPTPSQLRIVYELEMKQTEKRL